MRPLTSQMLKPATFPLTQSTTTSLPRDDSLNMADSRRICVAHQIYTVSENLTPLPTPASLNTMRTQFSMQHVCNPTLITIMLLNNRRARQRKPCLTVGMKLRSMLLAVENNYVTACGRYFSRPKHYRLASSSQTAAVPSRHARVPNVYNLRSS